MYEPLDLKSSSVSTVPGNRWSPDHRTPVTYISPSFNPTTQNAYHRNQTEKPEKHVSDSAIEHPLELLTHIEFIDKLVDCSRIPGQVPGKLPHHDDRRYQLPPLKRLEVRQINVAGSVSISVAAGGKVIFLSDIVVGMARSTEQRLSRIIVRHNISPVPR